MSGERQRQGDPGQPDCQRIVIRDLVVACRIGVKAGERAAPQRLNLNLLLEINPRLPAGDDDLAGIVDYGLLVERVRRQCRIRERRLLETLARELAEACFFDTRVRHLRLRIEKLDRFEDIAGIGIELEWSRDPA